ncbi:unnamed protein product [Colias eurytheme]|nr:unnamed protein product [Colias eurytheme]
MMMRVSSVQGTYMSLSAYPLHKARSTLVNGSSAPQGKGRGVGREGAREARAAVPRPPRRCMLVERAHYHCGAWSVDREREAAPPRACRVPRAVAVRSADCGVQAER